jgi:hypothetical protein
MNGKKLRIFLFIAIVTAGFMLMAVPQASAVSLFDDDLDDGNHVGWSFSEYANFTCYQHSPSDCTLYSGISDTIGQQAWCDAPSMSHGTWSFDVFHPAKSDSWIKIGFFANSSMDWAGYYLEISVGDWDEPAFLRLARNDNDSVSFVVFDIFDSSWCNTWTEFDITRNSTTGETNVFVNGTYMMTGTDTTCNRSNGFNFANFKAGPLYDRVIVGAMLDNLLIDSEITLERPVTSTTTDTETGTTSTSSISTASSGGGGSFSVDPLLLAAGGGAVVLLVVVVLLKRR